MHRYFIKTPWWVQQLFSNYVWRIAATQKVIYLTFDDGPHPTITPWVLDELKKYDAKATFFCIGKNVEAHPAIYNRIIAEGHATGNHTYQHLNGWKTGLDAYLGDVAKASRSIDTNLFRPPYGRITSAQARNLATMMEKNKVKVIMWDVLSADFDKRILPIQCAKNVLKNVSPGSVVVFHDSEKAFENLRIALPDVLRVLGGEGYIFEKIVMRNL
ncbi:MAG TPA: polysaccharide deacetylase family protein [Flavisolibacter sp.]|jgi:peptidoglycan/xylan/chitin deacetylase (PgdA/CDA1 family)|nr:polysaccharide deacetylase family protein [Flavisolibacter sp.]